MFELILPHLPPRLQEALLSPEYSEICVNEDGRVFVEAAGSNTMLELLGIAPTQIQLRHAVNAIARTLAHCEADEANPILNARLADGSRVAAMLPPVTDGVVLTVRKFRPNWFTLEELVMNGTISPVFQRQLIEAVALRQNILISGPTGSGKTTLVKALLDLIPREERILLIEDTAELPLERPNRVRVRAREGVTIRDLLKASLRHRPDRIIVREVRDGAAYDLLQALNTGHAGSISTLHASSATQALNRLARLALQADTGLPFASIQSEIADAFHYVAHFERRRGRRELTELALFLLFSPIVLHDNHRRASSASYRHCRSQEFSLRMVKTESVDNSSAGVVHPGHIAIPPKHIWSLRQSARFALVQRQAGYLGLRDVACFDRHTESHGGQHGVESPALHAPIAISHES